MSEGGCPSWNLDSRVPCTARPHGETVTITTDDHSPVVSSDRSKNHARYSRAADCEGAGDLGLKPKLLFLAGKVVWASAQAAVVFRATGNTFRSIDGMNLRQSIALACLGVPALAEIGLGLVYLTASQPMPYHREALAADWASLEPGTRALVLTLLNGYGSTHLAVGLVMSLLIGVLFRCGHAWARWAMLAAGLPVLGATVFLSHRLATMTGAGVPWKGALALVAAFLIGIALAKPSGSRSVGDTA